jgi:hypothetical protein
MWLNREERYMKIIATFIILFLCLAVSPAFAGDVIDGTKPLLCATIEALDCDPGVPCERGIPEIMGAPQFLRIDFAKNEIAGPKRASKIRSLDKDDDQIILQGYGQELGMGWTVALDRSTGSMRIVLASNDATFIIFGACTTY